MLPNRASLRDGGGLDGSDLTPVDLRVFMHLDGLARRVYCTLSASRKFRIRQTIRRCGRDGLLDTRWKSVFDKTEKNW